MKEQEHLDDADLISRYLLGKLEGEELQQVTLRLLQDKAFREEVDRNRLLMKTLWKAGKETSERDPKSGRSWWWGIPILLLLVLGAGYFFWPSTADEQPAIQQTPPPAPPPATEKDTLQQTLPPQQEQENPTPPTPPQESEPKSEKRPVLIAANFEPNPMLEVLIDNPVRSTELQLSISTPAAAATLPLQNNSSTFRLSGQGRPATGKAVPKLICYFFSNKEADFENFEPLFSAPLQLKMTSPERFDCSLQYNLKPIEGGLYYYVISDEEEENIYYVGKVNIR